MAVVRGHIGNFPVVLASAHAIRVESVNAPTCCRNRAALSACFAEAALPHLKASRYAAGAAGAGGGFLLPVLLDHMRQTLERKEQLLLFLNRRGYVLLTLCRVCGDRFGCPVCSAWWSSIAFAASWSASW